VSTNKRARGRPRIPAAEQPRNPYGMVRVSLNPETEMVIPVDQATRVLAQQLMLHEWPGVSRVEELFAYARRSIMKTSLQQLHAAYLAAGETASQVEHAAWQQFAATDHAAYVAAIRPAIEAHDAAFCAFKRAEAEYHGMDLVSLERALATRVRSWG
jgi:hypothetical protein